MGWEDFVAETRPAELFHLIQDRFRELGLFDQTLTLTIQGQKYLARCDAQAFTVYRCIDNCHIPPGVPGWPVCLVSADTVIDETSPPQSGDDEFASGLALADWLNLIESRFKK
ncbi:MAG: hypothetical protein FJ134_16305 [Deltaproteobacteria bacterium]|nr:hypothetical protein [Deltaproteobacteria bacterium]